MRVRGDQNIDAPDLAAPQVRGNHVLSGVEIRLAPAAAKLQHASAVDHHSPALWKHQQQAVALSHVDGREFQRSRGDLGRPRLPQQQREQGQHRRGGNPAPAAMPDQQCESDQRRRETQGQPQRRIRHAPGRLDVRVPIRGARGNFKQPSRNRRGPIPAAENGEEPDRNRGFEQRNDDQVRRQPRE